MKYISRLLLLCLLLAGCSEQPPTEPVFIPTETVAVPGLYDTGSGLEISSSGAVKLYPLGSRTGKGILPFSGGILLFSEGEKTTLTLLTGDTLVPDTYKNLGFSLSPEDCVTGTDTLSYFDPVKNQTILLDASLSVAAQIPAPAGLTGKPILSGDGQLLYYCTATAIRVWEISSNIHRILRETTPSEKTLLGLYDGFLQYQEENGSLCFLSTQTGSLLYQEDTPMKLAIHPIGYTAATWETNLWSLVFSLDGTEKQALTPRDLSCQYFLLENHQVVTASQTGTVVTLDHYDLTGGHRTASQMFQGSIPLSVTFQEGIFWGLAEFAEYGGTAIFRWEPSKGSLSDSRIYTGPHYTAQNPDLHGLEHSMETARQIGSPYGIEILVWEEAAAAVPESLSAVPEHRVNILNRELELLEQYMAQFPSDMLKTTAENFSSFHICLVAQTGESSGQFFSGNRAYILLAAGSSSEQALYHELYHAMETHILSHSSALDQWSSLNPQGFRYDYDYRANAIRNSGMYLTEENRSFIDTFSMSFPKEDRARIFEYAMMPGQSQLFKTKAMQKKLSALCQGIREAYGLDSPTPYPWEQYLK